MCVEYLKTSILSSIITPEKRKRSNGGKAPTSSHLCFRVAIFFARPFEADAVIEIFNTRWDNNGNYNEGQDEEGDSKGGL